MEQKKKIDYTFKARGTSFYQDKIKKIYDHPGFSVNNFHLQRDPENEHDPNAIKIMYNDTLVGWIPRLYSKTFSDKMDSGVPIMMMFVDWNTTSNFKTIGITIRVKEI